MPKKSYGPVRNTRPKRNSASYYVPTGSAPGVVSERIPFKTQRSQGATGSHACFVCDIPGVTEQDRQLVCWNPNDYGMNYAEDGFDKSKYLDMLRPFADRKKELKQWGSGQCLVIANALSNWWQRQKPKDELARFEKLCKFVVSAESATELIRMIA
jgi:hypothetical protein